MFKKRKFIISAIVVVVLPVGFIFFNSQEKVQTARASIGPIADTVAVSGNVLSNGQTPIYSETSGIITAIYVENGDMVAEGQTLATIKSTASESEKKRALANYTAAQSKKNTDVAGKTSLQSQLEAARQAVLVASSAVSTMEDNRNNGRRNPATGKDYTQTEIDSIYSALTSARQSFTAAEKLFTSADTNIQSSSNNVDAYYSAYRATQDSVITAPTSGYIANLAFVNGDKVTATALEQGAQTTPLLLITGYTQATVKVLLNEAYISKVKTGMPTTITLDALPDKKYEGTVGRIDSVGTNTEGVITYNAYITMTNPDQEIRAGMTANATITVADHRSSLLVPNSALQLKDANTYVSVKKNGRTVETPVKVGIRGKTMTEVVTGLQPNDEVILSTVN